MITPEMFNKVEKKIKEMIDSPYKISDLFRDMKEKGAMFDELYALVILVCKYRTKNSADTASGLQVDRLQCRTNVAGLSDFEERYRIEPTK